MPSDAELQAALAEQEAHPDDGGVVMYVFAQRGAVAADHPAVLAFPHLFVPVDD